MKPKLILLLDKLCPATAQIESRPPIVDADTNALRAKQIMRQAVNDVDMLDEIKERACIRWEQGYSDSLYMAVLGNITDTNEEREYLDKPDEVQAAFLRRMGFSEADIQDKTKCPSAWLKLKPRINWDAELREYR